MGFQRSLVDNAVIIKFLNPVMTRKDEEELGDLIRDALETSLNSREALILDLDLVTEVSKGFARIIATNVIHLKKRGKNLGIISDRTSLRNFLKQDQGLSVVVGSSFTEVSAMLFKKSAPKAGKTYRIDVEFVKPFIEAAIKTLKVQCQMDVKAGKPALRPKEDKFDYALAGIIGLTANTFRGSIALCFPKKVFLGAISRMLGEDYKEVTRELEDGAGELLNIIFGQAKVILNEKGYRIEKAIPTVVSGQFIGIKHLTADPAILIPFETEFGTFNIEIGVDNEQGGAENV